MTTEDLDNKVLTIFENDGLPRYFMDIHLPEIVKLIPEDNYNFDEIQESVNRLIEKGDLCKQGSFYGLSSDPNMKPRKNSSIAGRWDLIRGRYG